MRRAPDAVVVVPARDESEAISGTIRSITAALKYARRRHVVAATTVQVVAHRCRDDIATRARSSLRRHRSSMVVEDTHSQTIGQVRDSGALRGIALLDAVPAQCWVLSTDADTWVPQDWVVEVLARAERLRATAVVGLTELDRFRGSARAEASYRALLASKLVDGDELRQHDHVYGANLAIRADVYLSSGGFPHVPHGEDQKLVDHLVATGSRVLRTREIVVVTSGRQQGRAEDGLATLLRELDAESHVFPDQTWAPPRVPVHAKTSTPTVKR